ncbi:T9SS type A sorting domain-containing protein [Riemerella anatipestifer]|uniref:T9SS type A sorting domain-containing protein n=1 Tax=Riemerella anatipestifer TaxID=34085 RepID=UPI0030BE07A5
MKSFLKLLAIGVVANFNAQLIPSAQQMRQQEQAFYNNATVLVKQQINPQTGVPYLSTGINLSMVDSFANLYQFNDVDYNTADADLFLQAMSELHNASAESQFLSASELEAKRDSQISLQNFSTSAPMQNTVQIGIINTDFDFLFYDAENESNGGLTLQNGVFQPIAGKPSAFTKHLVMIAPQKSTVSAEGGMVSFHVNLDIYFNKGKKITHLTANFGDGVIRNLITNGLANTSKFSVNYSSPGKKVISFNVVYEDGSTFTTYGSILVTFPTSPLTTFAANSCTAKTAVISYISKIPYQAWTESAPKYGKMEYKIFYADNNQSGVCGIDRVKKPFIVIDGFDPGDKRRIEKEDCDEKCKMLLDEDTRNHFNSKYQSIFDLMTYKINSNNPNEVPKLISKILNEKGYDVIIINLPTERAPYDFNRIIHNYGADFIERNAMSFVSFLQDLNASMHNRGITEKAVVVGPSMGGQITRYALAYMEKKQQETGSINWNHNTKLWISMDSPHQGANIPLALQGSIAFLGYNRGLEDAKSNYEKQLMAPAARQMLIEHAEEKLYGKNGGVSPYFTKYQQNLHNNGVHGSNGYPLNLKKIAIVNGSITGTKNVNAGQTILDMRGYIDMSWLFFKWTINTFRSTQLAQPEYQQSKLLYHIGAAKPGLPVWSSSELSRPNSFSKGSLDAVPGGYYNAINDFKDQSAQTLRKKKQRRRYYVPHSEETPTAPLSFIPTHSALDTSGFSDWYQPIDKNLVCAGQTPFDSYYGETTNMEHISFTPNMVQWLLSWLNGNELTPPSNLTLNDNSVICENTEEFYSFSNICEVPTGTNFSTSPSLSVVNVSSSGITVKGVKNGLGFIYINLPNKQTITKKIWVGKPQLRIKPEEGSTNYVIQRIESLDTGATLEDQGLTPADVTWTRKDTGAIRTGYTYFANGRGYNWRLNLEVNAKNKCGSTTYTTTITPPPPGMCEYTYTVSKVQNDDYTIARIMEPVCPKQSPEDNNLIQSQNTSSETYHITVVNSLGNTVIQKTGKDFSLSNLPTGSYFVKIIKDGQMLVEQTLIKK